MRGQSSLRRRPADPPWYARCRDSRPPPHAIARCWWRAIAL